MPGDLSDLSPDDLSRDRLARLATAARDAGVDAVLIAPGADLTYLLGHSVDSHERLTGLVVAAADAPTLLVPALERGGWSETAAERLIEIPTWTDGQDSYAALARLLPRDIRSLAVDDHLPAMHVLNLGEAVPDARLSLAGVLLAELRMRKDAAELAALADVGAAVDRVQSRVGEWLRAGRTERAVAADIAAALVEEGHSVAEFVIVASGPNSASPHHDASDRVIEPGDAVVIDIGGPAPSGYVSDCTRTFRVAGESDPLLAEVHAIVRAAQDAGVAAVRPGATAESVDAAARAVIVDAGYGDAFITRTGHGIGLEVHEHPYIVSGNSMPLEPGMTFSIEPGIYLPGRFGVRIEDIVAVTADGVRRLNEAPRDLVTVG